MKIYLYGRSFLANEYSLMKIIVIKKTLIRSSEDVLVLSAKFTVQDFHLFFVAKEDPDGDLIVVNRSFLNSSYFVPCSVHPC